MPPVNIITPWPNQRNGIADYSFEISKYLTSYHNVITECVDAKSTIDRVRLMHPNESDAIVALQTGINIFHIGNNPDHIFAVPLFLRYSGHVVLHDVSLHFLSELVDFLIPGFFEHFLRVEYPGVADKILKNWRHAGRKEIYHYKEIAMLSWLGSAKSFIVHSHYALKLLQGYFPTKDIHYLPHFAYPTGLNIESISKKSKLFRRKFHISDDQLIVAAVGFVTKNKQYEAIVKAINHLKNAGENKIKLIIAGERRAAEFDIERIVHNYEVEDCVMLLDFLTEGDLQDLLIASDVVVNLRYPTYGESSGSVARALGCGSIVMVSDAGSYSELPSDICLKIPAKDDPCIEIANALQQIMKNRDELIERRAKILDYATQSLHPIRICEHYTEVLKI